MEIGLKQNQKNEHRENQKYIPKRTTKWTEDFVETSSTWRLTITSTIKTETKHTTISKQVLGTSSRFFLRLRNVLDSLMSIIFLLNAVWDVVVSLIDSVSLSTVLSKLISRDRYIAARYGKQIFWSLRWIWLLIQKRTQWECKMLQKMDVELVARSKWITN